MWHQQELVVADSGVEHLALVALLKNLVEARALIMHVGLDFDFLCQWVDVLVRIFRLLCADECLKFLDFFQLNLLPEPISLGVLDVFISLLLWAGRVLFEDLGHQFDLFAFLLELHLDLVLIRAGFVAVVRHLSVAKL